MKDKKGGGDKTWNDLIFSTIEKLAQAPGKLKDSKEPVAETFEFLKGIKDNVQSKFDLDGFAKKVAEHIGENFDLEVNAKVSLKRKGKKGSPQ